jgi:hypothetical protein
MKRFLISTVAIGLIFCISNTVAESLDTNLRCSGRVYGLPGVAYQDIDDGYIEIKNNIASVSGFISFTGRFSVTPKSVSSTNFAVEGIQGSKTTVGSFNRLSGVVNFVEYPTEDKSLSAKDARFLFMGKCAKAQRAF